MTLAWVALGGALGALTRFGLGEAVRAFTRWPGWVAVFYANVAGTTLLGLLHFTIGHTDAAPASAWAFGAIGYCGALTTYSAFGLDTVLLWYEGRRVLAVGQFAATLTSGALVLKLASWALGSGPT